MQEDSVEDLVKRNLAATKIDKVWVADTTYVPTREGFLYLACVLDAHSIRICGWSMENHLKTKIVLNTLLIALWRKNLALGLVHHPCYGAQYAAPSFSERLREVGITPSMERTGNTPDNALAEHFLSTLKTELVSRLKFLSRQAAKTSPSSTWIPSTTPAAYTHLSATLVPPHSDC